MRRGVHTHPFFLLTNPTNRHTLRITTEDTARSGTASMGGAGAGKLFSHMVSRVSSSIGSLLATSYSQLGQAASLQQIRADEIANRARLQAAELERIQQSVTPISRDQRSSNQGVFIGLDQRQQTLRDLARARADISPTDEAQLFSVETEEVSAEAPSAVQTIFEQASDGVFYAVNENGSGRRAQAEAAAARNQEVRQQQVADLYQRNFDAQFEAPPAFSFAA